MSLRVTVREAFLHMTVVRDSVQRFRRFAAEVAHVPVGVLPGIEYDIRTLHSGIVKLLRTIHAGLDEFVRLGLRVHEEEWYHPPNGYEEALEQLEGIMNAVEELITSENENLLVPSYHEILAEQDLRVLQFVQRSFQDLLVDQEEDLAIESRGASEEEINSLGVHIAEQQDVGYICSICLDEITEGKPIRLLPCSHRFHKDCIDGWLRINATCPSDRSQVF